MTVSCCSVHRRQASPAALHRSTERRQVHAVLGCPLYSAQFKNCHFVLLVESDDVIVTAPQ
jgi:hypothetical protein